MQTVGFIIAFAGLLASVVAEAEIVVESSSPLLQVGDDVTVRCRVSGLSTGQLLYWWKKQADQETQLGTNSFVNEIFEATGRYTMEIQDVADGAEVVFLLNIRGAQPEDSGEVGCSIVGVQDSKQYTRIDVITSPTSIRLYAMRSNETNAEAAEEFTDGQEVAFNQGDEYYFRCAAEGSTYPPAFALAIGDRDLTEHFTSEAEYVIGEGQPGLKRLIYAGKATTHEPVIISIDENSLEFTCTAAVPGWETKPQIITIKPMLKFAPIISCPKRVVKDVYDKFVDIVCTIKAEPAVEEVYWTYEQEVEAKPEPLAEKMQKFDYTHILNPGESHIHYTHKLEDGESPDTKKSTLYIERAYPNTFRTYKIYARNELGEAEKTVIFDMENPGALQAASSIYVSTFLIATFAAIAYVLKL